MLVNSISAAHSAAPSVAKNTNFNGKVRLFESKNLFANREHLVIDTDDLPEVEYRKEITSPDKRMLYTERDGQYTNLYTKETPVYRAVEPCLKYIRHKTAGDKEWANDLYLHLADGKRFYLGNDFHGDIYSEVHHTFEAARRGETDLGGRSLSIDVKA